MAAPVRPYVSTELVAMLQKNLLKGQHDFSDYSYTYQTEESAIPKASITQFIKWVSSQIEMKFSEAGYLIPFQVITGEEWPEHQTEYLELLVVLGVSSLIATSLKPAPATGPGNTASQTNDFTTRFDKELKRILDGKVSSLRWRAAYYLGTPAEVAVTEPTRPKSDWLEGYKDKTKSMNLTTYTELMQDINDDIVNLDGKWDYMFDRLGMGYGY